MMNDNDKTWKIIKEGVETLKKVDAETQELADTLGLTPDSVLIKNVYVLADLVVKQLDAILNDDDDDWISWFVWDNNYGSWGLRAGKGEDMIKVRSLEDLRDAISNK